MHGIPSALAAPAYAYLEMYDASTKGGTHVVANTKMSLCRNKS